MQRRKVFNGRIDGAGADAILCMLSDKIDKEVLEAAGMSSKC